MEFKIALLMAYVSQAGFYMFYGTSFGTSSGSLGDGDGFWFSMPSMLRLEGCTLV